ncbi:MAG: hypothetical protein BGP06_13170 [Rhizobiales bacterium 65-9]|nr:DUF2877 domain-containing protein [Hyphomicrobiales bacterium]OJY34074.1 MAG: hypothetical protein BGP06_13170 [Rhizobiales bacterium 65-9]
MIVRIARVGPFARRFLEQHASARVSAVFARSLHLEAGDDALCVVDATLGNGALNAVLTQPFATFPAPAVGATARIAARRITTGDGHHFDAAAAADWSPTRADLSPPSPAVVAALMQAALARAPADGAFRAALDDGHAASSPVERALRERTRALSRWMATGEGAPPVSGLIGLGSGLTPAGDDFIGGAMIALRLAGRPEVAAAIAGQVAAGVGATTILSGAMLRAAAGGIGGETLHETLFALSAGDEARAIALLAQVARIGHTSGWDALAGALAALGASFGRFRPECAAASSGDNQRLTLSES